MFGRSKNKPRRLHFGLGAVGLIGGLAFAIRYAAKKVAATRIPDSISPAVFATRISQTTYGEMIYHSAGTGDAIVFLHGVYVGASSYEWSKVYPYFTSHWQVLAPDLIGFGESQRPSLALDAQQHVCALRECFFEASGGRSVVVVASGISAGLALLVASQHPTSIKRLILYEPNDLTGSNSQRSLPEMEFMGKIPFLRRFIYKNYIAREPFLKSWLSRFGLSNPEHLTDEMLNVITAFAQQYGANHAILGLLRGKFSFPLLRRLSSIAHPITLLWPEESDFFPLEDAQKMVSLLPRARLRLIPYRGVLAPLENPEGFQKLIEDGLEDTPQGGNN